jgi:hypothetical protein
MAIIQFNYSDEYRVRNRVVASFTTTYDLAHNYISDSYKLLEPPYPTSPGNLTPGSTILLLGVSNKGPFHKPLYIKNQAQADQYFGGDLAMAFKEAKAIGTPNVFLMRIGEFNENSVTKNMLYIYLQEAYEYLYGYQYDYIVPIGAFFDDSADLADPASDHITFTGAANEPLNYARQLAEFCERKLLIGEYAMESSACESPVAI